MDQGDAEFAAKLGKPFLHVHAGLGIGEAARRLRLLLDEHEVRVLNVAGPRASKEPGVAEFAMTVLATATLR